MGKKCELDTEKYRRGEKPEELICPVCYVFGTTGWSRRFRLGIDENSYQIVPLNLAIGGLSCKSSPPHRSVELWLRKALGTLTPLVIKGR